MQYTMIDQDGKESRLLPAGQLRSWYAAGHLTGQTLLRRSGEGQAKPLAEFDEFQDLLLAKVPPAAPAAATGRTSMWAAISLLTGVASLVIGGWGPFIGFAAIISGHVARREAREKTRDVIFGRNIAMAGLLAGYLAMLMALSVAWDMLTSETGACQQQLRNIGIACLRYAADDDQHRLPPDLATLVQHKYVANGQFFACPAAKETAVFGGRALAQLQYRDYIYLAEGLSLNQLKNPAKTLMIVERPGRHFLGAVNVVYCDGHAETRYKVGWNSGKTQ